MTHARKPKTAHYTRARRMQERWKTHTSTLPEGARAPGTTWVEHHGKRVEVGPFPICLPTAHALLNLLPSIRQAALDRFDRHDIHWHGWTPGPGGRRWPSSHLLDSQVQCVNTLMSLARAPGALLELARQAEPDTAALLAVEDGSPVAFEWIGAADYLGERRGRPRNRGRLTTSVDALLLAERADGGRTGILVEWKFTESYDRPVRRYGSGGWDRAARYGPPYLAAERFFARAPAVEAFFHDPHDQLLRQALLAIGMLQARELGMDRAVLLHLVPSGNAALRSTVPPGLASLGDSMDSIWEALLPGPDLRYGCVDASALYTVTPELAERYGAPRHQPSPASPSRRQEPGNPIRLGPR